MSILRAIYLMHHQHESKLNVYPIHEEVSSEQYEENLLGIMSELFSKIIVFNNEVG
jgi:hypothetical protein